MRGIIVKCMHVPQAAYLTHCTRRADLTAAPSPSAVRARPINWPIYVTSLESPLRIAHSARVSGACAT